jgi:IS5 family transposase
MLRMYFIQQWYGLADVAVEDAIFIAKRCVISAVLTLPSSVPDSTTLMDFRHLLEKNAAAAAMPLKSMRCSKARLAHGQGTLIDATLIAAPAQRKQVAPTRSEMHQTKNGQ